MERNHAFYVTFERRQTLSMSVRAKDANEARQQALIALRDVEEYEWDTDASPAITDVDGPLPTTD